MGNEPTEIIMMMTVEEKIWPTIPTSPYYRCRRHGKAREQSWQLAARTLGKQ
jgi:hypothetical protein